jgi:uncharacterized tellurite resistance protein B-like protein
MIADRLFAIAYLLVRLVTVDGNEHETELVSLALRALLED